jgi:hypothetical protein
MLKHAGFDAPGSLSDILLLEIDMRWSREPGLLAATDAAVPMGAVLGTDASGCYVPYMTELAAAIPPVGQTPGVPAVNADDAVAVLISRDIAASEDEQPCTVIRRGACVAVANLRWLDGLTEEQKQNALKALSARGIVPKE